MTIAAQRVADGVWGRPPRARIGATRVQLHALLREHAQVHLERYKAPGQVIVLDEFPRTHVGTIDRGRLRGWNSSDAGGQRRATCRRCCDSLGLDRPPSPTRNRRALVRYWP